jgi:hypothetical protein
MPSPSTVESFVTAAREYVRRVLGVELDGSDTSLAYVDHYIEKTIEKEPLKEDVLPLVAAALGAYFGEVAIARFGGRWLEGSDDPASWQIELQPAELRFHPVGMAAEALARDEVPGFDASFVTRPALMAMLGDALAASPPVDEAYYYSLTGRLETLEQALQIVVELERRLKEDGN